MALLEYLKEILVGEIVEIKPGEPEPTSPHHSNSTNQWWREQSTPAETFGHYGSEDASTLEFLEDSKQDF